MEHYLIDGPSITLPNPDTAHIVWPGGGFSIDISPDELFYAPVEEQLTYNLGLAFRLSGLPSPASQEFLNFITSATSPGRDGFELAGQKLYVWRITTNSDGTYRLEFGVSKNGPTQITLESVGAEQLTAFPGEEARRQAVLWNIASWLRKGSHTGPLKAAHCNLIKAAQFWF